MGRIALSGSSASKLDHSSAAYLESIQRPRVKVRVKGDAFSNVPNFSTRTLFRFPGKNNLRVIVERISSTEVKLVYGETGNGLTGTASCLLSSISTSADYIVYFKAGSGTNNGNGPGTIALYDSSGSALIGPESVNWFSTGTTGTGTGGFQLGDGTSTWAIDLDGAALYSADPPSNWAKPSTGDSGLLNLWWFEDGSGSTAASANSATNLTVTNGTFSSTAGDWDASVATALFRPYFITG